MQNDYWRHISTICVNYIQRKPYYAYLSVLDAHSSSYIVSDVSPTILILQRSENDNYGTPVSTSKVHYLLFRVFQHQNFVFFKDLIQPMDSWMTHVVLYKTYQFHVQLEFLFSSKRPVLVRAWQKYFFVSAVKL